MTRCNAKRARHWPPAAIWPPCAAQWEGQAREAFSRKTDIELTREDVASWDFEEIPAQVRSDGGLMAFPALVDLGETVALRVFERSDEATAANIVRAWCGCCAMPWSAMPSRRDGACRSAMRWRLKYAPLGGVDGLREDLLEGGFDDLLERHELDVRTAGALRGTARAVYPRAVRCRRRAAEAGRTDHRGAGRPETVAGAAAARLCPRQLRRHARTVRGLAARRDSCASCRRRGWRTCRAT